MKNTGENMNKKLQKFWSYLWMNMWLIQSFEPIFMCWINLWELKPIGMLLSCETKYGYEVNYVREFTRMNPPKFHGSKVKEDPQEFIYEVHMVLIIMGVTLEEKEKLVAY